jgi:Transcriptional regulators
MTTRRSKPTIYDIARLSGASPSTVSAALSGKGPSRRIAQGTVEEIQRIATDLGYSTNMQARGLRQARSHLVGMIIPEHDNRYFSTLSRSFEAEARARGLCPVIVSTLRDPAEEIRTVETLISYQVDFVLVAGASDPEAISRLCDAARKPHVFVDLPGWGRPSVVTDNHLGAVRLTEAVLDAMPATDDPLRGRPYLVGGVPKDYATARRIEGFRASVTARLGRCDDDQIIACGYAPGPAREAVMALCGRLGGLPAGLFVNSLTAFEGVLGHFVQLPPDAFAQTAIGCYDYDPFAAYLQFPVYMVRQNSDRLIETAFGLIESGRREATLVEIPPDLVPPRTIFRNMAQAPKGARGEVPTGTPATGTPATGAP